MKHCYIGWECCHEQPRDTFFNFIMWLVVLEHVCWHITNHAMKMPQALVDRKETLLLLVIYLTHWILVELWSLDSDVIVRRIFDIAKLRLAYMSVWSSLPPVHVVPYFLFHFLQYCPFVVYLLCFGVSFQECMWQNYTNSHNKIPFHLSKSANQLSLNSWEVSCPKKFIYK